MKCELLDDDVAKAKLLNLHVNELFVFEDKRATAGVCLRCDADRYVMLDSGRVFDINRKNMNWVTVVVKQMGTAVFARMSRKERLALLESESIKEEE